MDAGGSTAERAAAPGVGLTTRTLTRVPVEWILVVIVLLYRCLFDHYLFDRLRLTEELIVGFLLQIVLQLHRSLIDRTTGLIADLRNNLEQAGVVEFGDDLDGQVLITL